MNQKIDQYIIGPPAELLGIIFPNFEIELTHVQGITCRLFFLTL